MRELIINNVGPIREARLNMDQLLMLVGPQGQGKSTIAKLFSFFLWLEKYVVSRQKADTVCSDEFIRERLIRYHRMESFFSEGTHLSYKSDVLNFSLSGGKKLRMAMVPDSIYEATTGKIGYIPAERMVLGLQGIASLRMEDDYIRDFIFDWLSVRNKYGLDNKMSLLNLQMDYYFDSAGGRDNILLRGEKEIPVYESSSGVQSITPIIVFYDYLTKWIYENKEDISFEQRENLKIGYINLLNHIDNRVISPSPEIAEHLIKLFEAAKASKELETKISQDDIISHMLSVWERISKPHFSHIIVEEPELSIYPETQIQLLAHMLRNIDFVRGDGLLITTHSPYLLNALNLFFKAYDTKQTVLGASLDFDKTGVYYVDNGGIVDIKAKNAHLVNPEHLSAPLDDIYEQYEGLS